MSPWKLLQLCVPTSAGPKVLPFSKPVNWPSILPALVAKLEAEAVWLLMPPSGVESAQLYAARSGEATTQALDLGSLDETALKSLWNALWRPGHLQGPDQSICVLLSRVELVDPSPPRLAAGLPEADFLAALSQRFRHQVQTGVVDDLSVRVRDRYQILNRLLGTDEFSSYASCVRERFYESIAAALAHGLIDEIEQKLAPQVDPVTPSVKAQPTSVSSVLEPLEPLEIRVGRGLLPLVSPQHGSPLIHRVEAIRKHLALQFGFIMPGIRFRDDLQLKSEHYRIFVSGQRIAQGKLQLGKLLALGPEHKLKALSEASDPQAWDLDPVYRMASLWVSDPEPPRQAGLLMLDPVSVVANHITDCCITHVAELFCFQSCSCLLDQHKKSHPRLHQALESKEVDFVQVWQLLRELLQERVSIRDLTRILQIVLLHPKQSLEFWVETSRAALATPITHSYTDGESALEVVLLDSEQEESLRSGPSSDRESLCRALVESFQGPTDGGWGLIFLTDPDCRRVLRDLLRPSLPRAVFLSTRELLPDTILLPLGPLQLPSPRVAEDALESGWTEPESTEPEASTSVERPSLAERKAPGVSR